MRVDILLKANNIEYVNIITIRDIKKVKVAMERTLIMTEQEAWDIVRNSGLKCRMFTNIHNDESWIIYGNCIIGNSETFIDYLKKLWNK